MGLWLLLFLTSPVFCEPHQNAESTPRQDANSGLDIRKQTLLSMVFFLPMDFIETRYRDSIPKALEEEKKGNPNPLASILADLMWTLGDKQKKQLATNVTEELKIEAGKTPRDASYSLLLTALKDAVGIFKSTKSTPSDEKGLQFQKAFEAAYEKEKASSDLFYEKLSQALDGNKQAQDFLRKQDPRAFLSFLDGQRRAGNDELVRNISRALGNRIDMVGPQGQGEHLETGASDADIDYSWDQFSRQVGFGSRTFSPNRLENSQRFRFARPEAARTRVAGEGPKETSRPVPPAASPVQSGTETNDLGKVVGAILLKKCGACHGAGKRNAGALSDGLLTLGADGLPSEGRNAIARILFRAIEVGGDGGDMPPSSARNTPLTAGEKADLIRWASSLGVARP